MQKVAVIIPIYNVERYVQRSLRSLLGQSLDSVEYILINDASTDRSMELVREVLAEFPQRAESVKIIEHAENMGISYTRAEGVRNASAEFIVQIDSDDYCEENMLEELYLTAKSRGADMVICNYYMTSEDGLCDRLQRVDLAGFSRQDLISKILIGDVHASLSNKLIAARLMQSQEPTSTCLMEDFLVCVRLLMQPLKVEYLDRAYLHYVQRASSATNRISRRAAMDAVEVVATVESELVACFGAELFHDELMFAKLNIRSMLFREGYISEARGLFREALPYLDRHPRLSVVRRTILRLYSRGWIGAARLLDRAVMTLARVLKRGL